MTFLPSTLLAGFDFSTLPQQFASGILIGAIYALVALGYTMVYGILKLINFAHGEVFMLGAYAALFASWALGYAPGNTQGSGNVGMLLIMLATSMVVCVIVGVLIERLAYRPMRSQPRIASLITAIGVSLLLQYGGQIFLLEGKPQNIDPKISPFYSSDPNVGNFILTLKGPNEALVKEAASYQGDADVKQAAFDAQLKNEPGGEFNLTPEGKRLRDLARDAARKVKDAKDKANEGTVAVSLPKGQVIMLGTVLILMTGLTYLVMFTKPGRAMRAVSLDFDTASMMGINVNTIVTFTFVLGSAMAGAGAMMAATFQSGTKIDTYFGVVLGTKAFVAAVLGGIGNIPGAVLGGLLMGVAEILVVWSGYDGYKDAIAFLLLIAVLLFRPGGLLGSSKVEKV